MKKYTITSILLVVALVFSACSAPTSSSIAPADTSEETPASTTTSEVSVEETSDAAITIVDQLGKEITFDAPPERLATTIMPFPYIFHAVMGDNPYMIGCNPSSVVAYEDSALRHMYPSMAEANTDWVDTSFVVNVEELLELKPDVVFQWNYMTEEIEKLEAAGIKVIALQYGTVEDLETWIRIISQLYQKEERGEEIISYFHESLNEVNSVTSQIPEEEKLSVVHFSDLLRVAGEGNFTNYWIEQSGGTNPAKDLSGDALNVDMEQMLLWDPDVIYIGNFTALQPSEILENKIEGQDWSLLSAVQNKQVYKIPIGGYRWDPPGVETPLMVKWLATIQYPELFADMDIREEVSEFYQEVYNFTLTEEMLDEILLDIQD